MRERSAAVDEDKIEPLVTLEVTIGRTIHADGQQGFFIKCSEPQYSFIEVLGLLEAAKWQLHKQMTARYGDQ